MNGVIYYNRGTKCLVRLLISIYSLRKITDIPITIISQSDDSNGQFICNKIAESMGVDIIDVDYNVDPGKNLAYIEACLCHTVTPYDISMWIDADTIIVGDFSKMFDYADKYEFAIAQFADWRTDGRVRKRIKEWSSIYPDYIKKAINYGPAINCGVFAFKRNSKLMSDWFELALPGRDNFIADESCCQLILPQYPHIVVDPKYNRSCKYDDPYDDDTRIIHYHGRKHCRLSDDGELMFGGDIWVDNYNEVIDKNIANICNWSPCGDRMLRKYLNAI